MRNKEVTISILPHLKKFIYKFYKANDHTPIRVDLTSSLGIAMKHVIREKKTLHKNYVDKLSESITFVLSSDISDLSLTPAYVRAFNQSFHRIFKEKMRIWIMAQWEAGINNRQAIFNFLEYYDLKDNEYSYDAAQRDWLRYKNQEGKTRNVNAS